MENKDEHFMRQALREAKKSTGRGEVPVGAVVVFENEIISRAHNQTIQRNDPTAHAEVVALRNASEKKNNYRLTGCDVFVTLEPCPMCVGAMVQARIQRVVFGAYDPKAGALGSIMRFPFDRMNHTVEIKGNVLSEECRRIIKDFFMEKRSAKSFR